MTWQRASKRQAATNGVLRERSRDGARNGKRTGERTTGSIAPGKSCGPGPRPGRVAGLPHIRIFASHKLHI